ncbi:UNVERIFIED_CONTAM: hypothetical protein FKN15_077408 [Acipenser sinensis]
MTAKQPTTEAKVGVAGTRTVGTQAGLGEVGGGVACTAVAACTRTRGTGTAAATRVTAAGPRSTANGNREGGGGEEPTTTTAPTTTPVSQFGAGGRGPLSRAHGHPAGVFVPLCAWSRDQVGAPSRTVVHLVPYPLPLKP